MVGYVSFDDIECSISDAECDWISYNGQIKENSVYYSSTDALSFTFEVGSDTDDSYKYTYFYSSDSMFSQRELSTIIYSGTVTPVEEDGSYYYHFDYQGEIDPGFYVISIDTADGESVCISVCQVVD